MAAQTLWCIRNESELVFERNTLSVFGTFIACVANVDGPKLIPSVDTLRVLPPVDMKTAIRLNNIGTIDPSGALVTLDFELALYWTDNRLNMPVFWNRVDPSMRRDGVRLERIFKDSAGRSPFWRSCNTTRLTL